MYKKQLLTLWECPACGAKSSDRMHIDGNGELDKFVCCGMTVAGSDDSVVKVIYTVIDETREEEEVSSIKPEIGQVYQFRNSKEVKKKLRLKKIRVVAVLESGIRVLGELIDPVEGFNQPFPMFNIYLKELQEA